MVDAIHYTQQLFNSGDRQRCWADLVGIELQIGCPYWHQTLNVLTKPDDTTTTEVGFIGDINERQGTAAERVARIGDGDRLFGG